MSLDACIDWCCRITSVSIARICLNRLPQPTEEDIAMKSERATLNGKQRWELFKNFMPFLMMLFVANIAIVVLRDIKKTFSKYHRCFRIFALAFAKIDSVVTLIILVVFGLMVFVKDNLKALSILFRLIIMGMIVMSVVSFGQERFQLPPVVWLFVQSLCLYIAYLTFQTIFFDRFIACFKIHGNVGFFIVTTDFGIYRDGACACAEGILQPAYRLGGIL